MATLSRYNQFVVDLPILCEDLADALRFRAARVLRRAADELAPNRDSKQNDVIATHALRKGVINSGASLTHSLQSIAASSGSETLSPCFMSMPTEIRNMIYQHLIPVTCGRGTNSAAFCTWAERIPAICYVNRTVFEETIAYFATFVRMAYIFGPAQPDLCDPDRFHSSFFLKVRRANDFWLRSANTYCAADDFVLEFRRVRLLQPVFATSATPHALYRQFEFDIDFDLDGELEISMVTTGDKTSEHPLILHRMAERIARFIAMHVGRRHGRGLSLKEIQGLLKTRNPHMGWGWMVPPRNYPNNIVCDCGQHV